MRATANMCNMCNRRYVFVVGEDPGICCCCTRQLAAKLEQQFQSLAGSRLMCDELRGQVADLKVAVHKAQQDAVSFRYERDFLGQLVVDLRAENTRLRQRSNASARRHE